MYRFYSPLEGLEQELSGEQLTTLELKNYFGLRDTLEIRIQKRSYRSRKKAADAVEEYQELLKELASRTEYSKEKR